MSKDPSLPLGPLVQNFFWQRLQAQQHVSPHTVASYRDTFRLFLGFAQEHLNKAAMTVPKKHRPSRKRDNRLVDANTEMELQRG